MFSKISLSEVFQMLLALAKPDLCNGSLACVLHVIAVKRMKLSQTTLPFRLQILAIFDVAMVMQLPSMYFFDYS